MYPDRKKFVLEPFMLVPVFSGKSYTKKVLSIDPANLDRVLANERSERSYSRQRRRHSSERRDPIQASRLGNQASGMD